MKTTADFVLADVTQKERLLIDGITFVTNRLKENALDLLRLNAWLRTYNASASIKDLKPVNTEELRNSITEFVRAHDDFSSHAMITSILTSVTQNKILIK